MCVCVFAHLNAFLGKQTAFGCHVPRVIEVLRHTAHPQLFQRARPLQKRKVSVYQISMKVQLLI
jgi:hypothetical protein